MQAAEKALKAVRYLKHYEVITDHNLTHVASLLNDPELERLAFELETLIKSSPHLLYPNAWGTGIPSEKYDENASIKAINLATEILAIADQEIHKSADLR